MFGAQILGEVYGASSSGSSGGDGADTATNNDDVTTDSNIRTTTWHEIIVLFMAVPGTLVSIYLMTKMTTRNLQMAGFLGK